MIDVQEMQAVFGGTDDIIFCLERRTTLSRIVSLNMTTHYIQSCYDTVIKERWDLATARERSFRRVNRMWSRL